MTSVEREVFAREETRELKERVVEINRVAKVVKGGRRFSFTALVVIGDEVDRVGVGYGKAREVPLAISKAVDDAKKNLFTIPKHGTTITHAIDLVADHDERGEREPPAALDHLGDAVDLDDALLELTCLLNVHCHQNRSPPSRAASASALTRPW